MITNDGQVYNEYLAVIIECIIYFTCGVHTGWTSPFLPKIQSSEYPFFISNEAASYIAILGPLGDLIGEMSILITDKIGRKITLLLAGLPVLLAWILIYCSNISPIFIYFARFFGGITMGAVLSVTPIYTSEISRPEIRGRLGVLSVEAFMMGLLCVNLAGNYLTIQHSALIFAGIVIIFFSTFSLMPETPYYYLLKKQRNEAEHSLKFFRRKQSVNKELEILSEDVKRQISESGTYRDLLKIDSNRKALTLMIFGRVFQQLTGGTTLLMFGQQLLQESNDIIEPQFAITIIAILQICCVIICGSISDRFGRVPLMVYSTGVCSLNLLLMGIYFTMKDVLVLTIPTWILLFTYTVFFISYQIGIGSLLNVLLGEMFSASVKPKAICVVNVMFSLVVMFTTKFYQIANDYLHISVFFYCCALCSVIGMVIVRIYFLETKGKTLEQIQLELKGFKKEQK